MIGSVWWENFAKEENEYIVECYREEKKNLNQELSRIEKPEMDVKCSGYQ